ncbi:MAG: hypothetical protein ACI81L_000488 [Verrucomicrobiales bacterium]|jgi:hypothetical protein
MRSGHSPRSKRTDKTCSIHGDRHFELYQSQRPSWFDEMELFESHMRICQTAETEERWRAGYRLVGLDV